MKNKYSARDLIEEIITICRIECSRCPEQEELGFIDDFDAAKVLFDKGWRKTSIHTYCPECAGKYLKNVDRL